MVTYQFKVGDWVNISDNARPDYVGRSVIADGPVRVTEVVMSLFSQFYYVMWDEIPGRACLGAWFTSVVLVDGGPW